VRCNASSIDADVLPTACWLSNTTLNKSSKLNQKKIRNSKNRSRRRRRLKRSKLKTMTRLMLLRKKNLNQRKEKKLQTRSQ